ncbi:MAG: citramalate synthase [Clostridiales bacterium]|nr:citramalate synthase [Clostridiales bacterium]
MKKLYLFDSTLRDGAQGENVNFSVMDKVNIVKALDDLGVSYIEAGNPFSNPKDVEFFEKVADLELKSAQIVAFGSTRRVGVDVRQDKSVEVMAKINVKTVAIFGKSWDLHATEVLHTTLEENIAMITDTIKYLKDNGKDVFFYAEHFFDGCKNNPEYAFEVLQAAQNAGASYAILCDTNGGCFPFEIESWTKKAVNALSIPVGIHCHNDTDCAVANTIAGVMAGAEQIHGTFIGIGERCGNTCLATLIPNLQIKLGYDLIPEENLKKLTICARYISDISNITLEDNLPYVGKSAFAHKGGMHIDGVTKLPKSFEHICPEQVGNQRQFLLSEVSGKSAVLQKLKNFAPQITKESPELVEILAMLKEQEQKGYQYEAASASFELLVRKFLGDFKPYFSIEYFKIISEPVDTANTPGSGLIKLKVGDQYKIAADEGNGPVNAIDKALRAALVEFYPDLEGFRLIDYKVRVVDTTSATAAAVRVLVESTDGTDVWTTVGSSTDIINASVMALVDSIEYKLLKSGCKPY